MENAIAEFLEKRDRIMMDYLPGRLALRWAEKFFQETMDFDTTFFVMMQQGLDK